MTSKQIRAIELLNDNITTNVGYGGSARSGKSIIECTAIIFDCFAYPDIAWGLARKELTTLKRTVLITLFNQLRFFGKSEKDYKYNQQSNKITFNNKSNIFLIDTAFKPSDPLNTRFGGFELTRSAIDESNETEQSVIFKLFERTGWRNNDRYKLKRKQFECFNPAKNHVYSRYYSLDFDYFDNINMKNSYWAGFIAADGSIRKDNKTLEISLNFKDKDILDNFKYDIKYGGEIKYRKNLNQYRILVKNRKIVDDLNRNFGTTIVIITHNPNIAQMAHIVIKLNSGRIVDVSENIDRKPAGEILWA
jgi:hypothetical protein